MTFSSHLFESFSSFVTFLVCKWAYGTDPLTAIHVKLMFPKTFRYSLSFFYDYSNTHLCILAIYQQLLFFYKNKTSLFIHSIHKHLLNPCYVLRAMLEARNRPEIRIHTIPLLRGNWEDRHEMSNLGLKHAIV